MDVSIVIVSYNGCDYLRRCLASVYEHSADVPYEVIVVDNASEDGTPDMVASEFPQAQLVRRPDNAGFARAVNQGIALGSGDAFLLLNPDAELSGNVLAPLLEFLREHRDIGILAPKILDTDGALQLSCRAFPGFATALFNRYSLLTRILGRNPLSRRYLMTDFDHRSVADVDWASAACWLLPRATIERVGTLDEGYFWSIEDVDYCQRVHRAGLRVVYFPEAQLTHHIGASAATRPARTIVARHRGMWRYYSRYLRPAGLVRWAADPAVWGGIQLRCALQLAGRALRRAIRRRG